MENDTELNKIKVVLCALYDNQFWYRHTEATNIIKQFKQEIDEIKRGN